MCQVARVLGFVDSDGGGVSETGYLGLPAVHYISMELTLLSK